MHDVRLGVAMAWSWLALCLLLTPATVASRSVTSIPFEFAGDHTFIEVEIKGQQLSFVCIIDSHCKPLGGSKQGLKESKW